MLKPKKEEIEFKSPVYKVSEGILKPVKFCCDNWKRPANHFPNNSQRKRRKFMRSNHNQNRFK